MRGLMYFFIRGDMKMKSRVKNLYPSCSALNSA